MMLQKFVEYKCFLPKRTNTQQTTIFENVMGNTRQTRGLAVYPL